MGREAGATVHVGPVVTSGIFYDPDPTNVPRWERLGHLGIEMEAAMLYTIAAVHRVESLAMMTVSDILGATEDDRERISDDAAPPRRRRHDAHRLPGRRLLSPRSLRTAEAVTEADPRVSGPGGSCAPSGTHDPGDGDLGSGAQIKPEVLHGVALLDELGGGGVDLAAAVVVDVEALDDLVRAVRAGAPGSSR